MPKFKGLRFKGGDIVKAPLNTCIACNGTGYYDAKGSPKCSACNGTGKEQNATKTNNQTS